MSLKGLTLPLEVIKPAAGASFSILHDPQRPVEAVRIAFALRTCDDAADLNLLTAMLSRGTKRHPSPHEFSSACDYAFGTSIDWDVFREGDGFCLCLNAGFISPARAGEAGHEEMVWQLLRESVHEPVFLEDSFDPNLFEIDRENFVGHLQHLETEPGPRAAVRAFAQALASDPMAKSSYGTIEAAKAASLDTLRNLYKRMIARARVCCSAVGPFATGSVVKHLSDIVGSSPRSLTRFATPYKPDGQYKRIREKGEGGSDQIVVFFARDPQARTTRANINAAAAVYASGSQSRLYHSLREEKGLAYGHGEMIIFEKRLMVVLASVLPGHGEEAVALIRDELRRAASDLRAEEIDAFRREAEDGVLKTLDSPRRLSQNILIGALRGREFDIARIARHLASPTVTSVRKALAAHSTFADYIAVSESREADA
jgi:predicted Zn-dependent peptidase